MNNQNTRLIRLPEVMNRTGYRQGLDLSSNQRRFISTTNKKLVTRAIAFVESEVDEWIASAIERSRKNAA
ncbi:DNA binding protein [Enterobacter cloacae subsp. cloacae GS1]|nr:DNA binding protein [Enterobacter cloacae subsp. cloacae GS1]